MQAWVPLRGNGRRKSVRLIETQEWATFITNSSGYRRDVVAPEQIARRMLSRELQYPVVSLFLDLDPSEFATAPARATQIRSLLDRGRRELEVGESLDREDHLALREDLDEIESRLDSLELRVRLSV